MHKTLDRVSRESSLTFTAMERNKTTSSIKKKKSLFPLNYSNVSLLLNLKLKVDFFHTMVYIQDIEYISKYITEYVTVLNKGENCKRHATESLVSINLAPGWYYN